MPTCIKCKSNVKKVYDCDHTDFQEYCVECYTELHYYITEETPKIQKGTNLDISIDKTNKKF